ncbi:DUF4321 domain-containing protein [Thermodesulfitimonas autotrophica]|uniref:DUF4321 domain-containing protein n=1 Tax=Thermodesulfitimonas autotrophica TaxID=1894989 RepID=UPI002FE358FF
MAKGFKASPAGPWLLVTLLLIGGLAGSALGEWLAAYVPALRAVSRVVFGPATLNLRFLTLTFGFSLVVGPLTALGFIIGYLAYRRL